MRLTRLSATVACVAALMPTWIGCGASEATNQGARGAEKVGLLDRLFPSGVEPIYIPAGTIVALRLDQALSSHQTPVGTSFVKTERGTERVQIASRLSWGMSPKEAVQSSDGPCFSKAANGRFLALLPVTFSTVSIGLFTYTSI